MANTARLTAAKIRNLTEDGMYNDGQGLNLQITNGRKNWVLRLFIGGKGRKMGLGSWPSTNLTEVRDMARKYQALVRQGRDPIAERQAAQDHAATVAATPSFKEVAEQVIALRRTTWASSRHATQWSESLRLHVYPAIGSRRVSEITTGDVLGLLTPIWTTKSETAARVKQRMQIVFDYAVVSGWRTDNPASAVDKALPRRARVKRHHAALPYAQLPAAVRAVRDSTADQTTKIAFGLRC